MRWFQISLGTLVLVLATAFSTKAYGQVKITSTTNASGEDLEASTQTIYGGVAGPTPTFADPSGLGNSCVNVTQPFEACNERVIQGTTLLTINFTSAKAGVPKLWHTDSGGTKTQVQIESASSSVSAGGSGSISVRWSQICNLIQTTAGDIDGNCTLASIDKATDDFSIGVSGGTTPDEDLDDAEDDKGSVQIVVATLGNAGQDSTTHHCNDDPNLGEIEGICSFEIAAGDEKVALSTLGGHSTFPNGTNLTYTHLRLYWAEGSTDPSTLTPQTATGKQDLEISRPGTSTDATITVTPQRIEGFKNEVSYAFKVAVIDAAGNIGFHTHPSVSGDISKQCADGQPRVGTAYGCHVATPGEVVGVLSEQVNCFVATAAYGSPMAKQVDTFRAFRDRFLIPSRLGFKFVRFYYKYSPQYARMIAQSESLRAFSRALLMPLLVYAWLSLQIGAIAAVIVMTVGCVLPYWAVRMIRLRKERGARA